MSTSRNTAVSKTRATRSLTSASPASLSSGRTPVSSQKVLASTPVQSGTPTDLAAKFSSIKEKNVGKIKSPLGPQLSRTGKPPLKVARSLTLDPGSANSTRVSSKSDSEDLDPRLLAMAGHQLACLLQIEKQKHQEVRAQAHEQLVKLSELRAQEAETLQELKKRDAVYQTYVSVRDALEKKLPLVKQSIEILSEIVPLLRDTAGSVQHRLGTLKLENLQAVNSKDMCDLIELLRDSRIDLDVNGEQIVERCSTNGAPILQHVRCENEILIKGAKLVQEGLAAVGEEVSLSGESNSRFCKKLADLDLILG